MASKKIKAAVVVALLTVGGYWYWSPFIAMKSMKSAAEKKDADYFNEHVDYPKLRESLKGQFSALMAEKLGASQQDGSDAEKAGAAFGSMLGMAFADKLVDAMVRPESVMRAMQEAQIAPKDVDGSPSGGSSKKEEVRWSYKRVSVDKLIAYAGDGSQASGKTVGLVFERAGFANWKLTEIRLPSTMQ